MDKENISGEKALIEERRKKLDQLRDRGDAYGNSFKPKNNVDESVYEDFKTWDLGDIVGVSGSLFRTKTDELTIDVWDLEMITKSLRFLMIL